MIKNERQYKITKAQEAKFQQALDRVSKQRESGEVVPWDVELQLSAFREQIKDLKTEIAEYEDLKQLGYKEFLVHSFSELPDALIKARIASGLSQAELADKLGLKEQQVQRYEATGYAGANLERLQEVVDALNVKVEKRLQMPSTQPTLQSVMRRLNTFGLNKAFVTNKLLPKSIQQGIAQVNCNARESEVLARSVVSWVGKIFNWTEEDILGDQPLSPQMSLNLLPMYKKPSKADIERVGVYTVYAHYLSLLALQCTSQLIAKFKRSTDPLVVRQDILAAYGTVDLESIVRYVWACGIPVLPLRAAGSFHGAFWRIDNRDIIVVKQNTNSLSRWMIDLLHEYYHASRDTDSANTTVIEYADILGSDQTDSPEEEADATWFAVSVILDSKAEHLVDECVSRAKGRVDRLKKAVVETAEASGVDVGALSNYLAYRLSNQRINWWGTAQSLQSAAYPWQIVAGVLFENIDMNNIDEPNRDLLLQALNGE